VRNTLVNRVLPALDRVGTVLGYVAMAMIVVLISLMLYEVVSRKVFDTPTMWANDITYMSNGTLFLIGAAYTLRRNAHIRIDFLSTRLPLRMQHLINLAFYLVIFLPALGLTGFYSTRKAYDAFVEGELETMSAWEPLIWPFLTGIAIGVIGLALQVTIESIRHVIGIAHPDAVPKPSDTIRT
jgi:TRAP-type mannitol/chloroaromatic compound transport system permease small subunit